VFLGSRDYGDAQRLFGHCDNDDGRPYGSSASEKDYARYNVVMQNQFYRRPVVPLSLSAYIKSQNWPVNSPNYIDYNQIVTEETVVNDRPAGCYVPNGYKNFILHGETIDVFKSPTGTPVCTGYSYTCHDGNLQFLSTSACNVERITFNCQVSGDNNGCNQMIGCPSLALVRRIVGAVAACNLEYGSVTDDELSTVPVEEHRDLGELGHHLLQEREPAGAEP
jgi:hypothetical protein